jgi:hypothetical protein
MLVTDLPLVSAKDTPVEFLSVPRCIELRRGTLCGVDMIALWWPAGNLHVVSSASAWNTVTVQAAVERLAGK